MALVANAPTARAQPRTCLPYEPELVIVSGFMQRTMAYGPPGFGETPTIDAKEPFLSLQLDAPMCVTGGDDDDQPQENSIRQLQIAFIKMPVQQGLVGRRVQITGTLFHATSGHHHTKILISPQKIEYR